MKVGNGLSVLMEAFLAGLVGFIVLLAHRLVFDPPLVRPFRGPANSSILSFGISLKEH